MPTKEVEVNGGLIAKIVFGAIFLNLVIVALTGLYTVQPGERAVLLTFGSAAPTPIGEGLHYRIPFAQDVIKMDIQTLKYEASASAASKDLQTVSTKIAVNYHLNPDNVVTLYSNIGTTYGDKIIQPAVQEVVKASTAKFSAEQLITNRQQVKDLIDEQLRARLLDKGIVMETTSITDFDFSQQFNTAIEAKVTAEQTALKAQRDLDRIRIEAQQTVTQAEATANSTKLKADAEAYALRVVQEQLQKSNQLVPYKAIEKWNGQLPVWTGGGAVPFVDVNSFAKTNTTA